jgi:pimeloyl-ACP methyl ester carboxylesterase
MTEIVELPAGRRASYHVTGRGIPALLFSGSGASCLRQHSVLFPFVLRSYVIDLPRAAEDSPEERARRYEEARDAIGLHRVVVFGHASGAAAALAYAAMYPEHTAACVAVAPVAYWPVGRAGVHPLLERVSCRTLIVAGELDLFGGPAQARPIAQRVPQAELVVLPDCGRRPPVEAPGGYRQVVLDFLRG